MPTVKVPAWDAGSLECGDLVSSRAEQGTNLYGRPSHAAQSYRGTKGFLQDGFRSAGFVHRTPKWTFYTSGTPSDVGEGAHEGNSWFVFRDIGVPQGATISDARLHATPGSVQDPTAQANSEWRLKIYGLAEDNAFPGRVLNPSQGYDLDWHHRHHPVGYWPAAPDIGWWPIPTERLRSGSVEYDREHTVAKVTWRWVPASRPGAIDAEWTSPSIASVIQEIVSRPGWSANNRLSLVLAIDDMFVGQHNENSFDAQNLVDYTWPNQWFIQWYGTRFTTLARRPHLTVTW